MNTLFLYEVTSAPAPYWLEFNGPTSVGMEPARHTAGVTGVSKTGSWLAATWCCVSILIISACGHSTDSQTSDALGTTCDQYSLKQLAPANIGGESQSTDISNLIAAHGMSLSIELANKVQSAVNQFCGRPSPYGGKQAVQNNSRPIDEAFDWNANR